MDKEFQNHISEILGSSIVKYLAVSGGDSSNAYKIETTGDYLFIKTNTATHALDMFKKEAFGLNLIEQTKTIKTPNLLGFGSFNQTAYLILEYIESKSATSADLEKLGVQLAQLHQCSVDHFGLETDNYIGLLTQSNKTKNNWLDFYNEKRLCPQLLLAKSNGLLSANEYPNGETIKERLSVYFDNIKPSLLHGDLWNGNYLISKSGTPYLIDPAVYYGHSEVDIAMSKLFGGFGNAFYNAYHANIPKDKYTPERIEMYQLYYLLVHLNMFGRSYYGSVSDILKKYF